MQALLKGKHMHYFRLFLILAGAWGYAIAEDKVVGEIVDSSSGALGKSKFVQKDIETFQKPMPLKDGDWLRRESSSSESASNISKTNSSTPQQRAWNEIENSIISGQNAIDQGPPHPKVPDDVMYVYISLSMPESLIKELFIEALATKSLGTVIFVLRGWEEPGPTKMLAKLNGLFPEKEYLKELPNVQVNPTLYRQSGIVKVPTYSAKDDAGVWGNVVGATSLKDARRRITTGKYLDEEIGNTYQVEEPDILAIIERKMSQVDWQTQVANAKESVMKGSRTSVDLPTATKNDSYLVDLTIVNNRDLKGPSGEVFAPTGAAVNPFDYINTTRKYVFFDANDEKQIETALRWKKEHDYTTMVSTLPVTDKKARRTITERFRQPVHEINSMIVKRFKLTHVPALAYQEGRMLRVDVEGIEGE